MPHRLERLHGRVAEAAALIERLIGQRLVMDPRCRDGVLQTHSLIEHVENDLRDRRDDRGTTRGADDQLEIAGAVERSEEHTSELQSLRHLVCRLLLEKKKNKKDT